jgi:hypothetical protein
LSALGRTSEARAELTAFESATAAVPEHWKVGANESKQVLGLAHAMLRGELLWREGEQDQAFAVMQVGAELEDQLVYDEPPGWMQPVRHAYGALLMAAGHADRAEAVYREDLERNPGNGWSLLGLQQALAAQGSLGRPRAWPPIWPWPGSARTSKRTRRASASRGLPEPGGLVPNRPTWRAGPAPPDTRLPG